MTTKKKCEEHNDECSTRADFNLNLMAKWDSKEFENLGRRIYEKLMSSGQEKIYLDNEIGQLKVRQVVVHGS